MPQPMRILKVGPRTQTSRLPWRRGHRNAQDTRPLVKCRVEDFPEYVQSPWRLGAKDRYLTFRPYR